MASATFEGKTSHGDIIEYAWTGVGSTNDNVAQSITAIGGHFEILEISLWFKGSTGVASESFLATKDHIGKTTGELDVEFFSEDMAGQKGVLQRWANNAGILIPLGSDADFTWTNTDGNDWGLSVFVRVE